MGKCKKCKKGNMNYLGADKLYEREIDEVGGYDIAYTVIINVWKCEKCGHEEESRTETNGIA